VAPRGPERWEDPARRSSLSSMLLSGLAAAGIGVALAGMGIGLAGIQPKRVVMLVGVLALGAVGIMTGHTKRLLLFAWVVSLTYNRNYFIESLGPHGSYGLYWIPGDIFFFSLLAIWAYQAAFLKKTSPPVGPRLWPWFLPWFLVLVLSTLSAERIDWAIFEMARVVRIGLILFYVRHNVGKQEWLICAAGLATAISIQALHGIVYVATGRYLGLSMFFGGGEQIVSPTLFVLEQATGSRRAQGTLGHPNTLGSYFLLTWPLFLAMAGAPIQRRLRIACGGIALLALAGIAVTLSRTSWAVSIGQIGLVALGLVAFGMLRAKRLVGLGVVGALAVAIVLAPFANRLYERLTGDFVAMYEFRVKRGEVALEIWQRDPLLGVGINNYSEILGEYEPEDFAVAREWGEFIRINMGIRITNWVHNIYLLFLAEQGILGLTAYLAFALGMLLRAARAVAVNVTAWRAAAYGMIVGMIGLHAHGLQESALWIDPLTYSFALIVALANNINAFAEDEPEAFAPRPAE